MISSELIEVVGLCDRVFVMRDGEFAAELSGSHVNEESIMSVAASGPSNQSPVIHS